MKKYIWAPVVISAAILFAACGGGEEKKSTETKTEETTPPAAQDNSMVQTVVGKGKELIEGQDCKTCHQIETKLVGPAYKDVAKKYDSTAAVIDTLSGKIIKGGSGNWGEIPMAPHPTISKDDAKEMVKYILSLKNS